MSKSVNKFVVEPFTNEFGQVINPGDKVIYAGSSWSRTSLQLGVYEGVYKGPPPYWKRSDKEEEIVAVRVGNVPSKKYIWNREERKGHYEDILRKAILPLKRVYKLDTSLKQYAGCETE